MELMYGSTGSDRAHILRAWVTEVLLLNIIILHRGLISKAISMAGLSSRNPHRNRTLWPWPDEKHRKFINVLYNLNSMMIFYLHGTLSACYRPILN
jgi:hypothetical protein